MCFVVKLAMLSVLSEMALLAEGDVGLTPTVLQIVIQGGSFAVLAVSWLYLLPQLIRELIGAFRNVEEAFKQEVHEVRGRSDARAEKIEQAMLVLVSKIEEEKRVTEDCANQMAKSISQLAQEVAEVRRLLNNLSPAPRRGDRGRESQP